MRKIGSSRLLAFVHRSVVARALGLELFSVSAQGPCSYIGRILSHTLVKTSGDSATYIARSFHVPVNNDMASLIELVVHAQRLRKRKNFKAEMIVPQRKLAGRFLWQK